MGLTYADQQLHFSLFTAGMRHHATLDTCRPVPDEVAHAEVEALEHKYGKEYTSYATHVLQQLERGESPVPAEGIGLACRAGKSSAWINWQGVMTPCVDMETPAVSLLSTTVSDA